MIHVPTSAHEENYSPNNNNNNINNNHHHRENDGLGGTINNVHEDDLSDLSCNVHDYEGGTPKTNSDQNKSSNSSSNRSVHSQRSHRSNFSTKSNRSQRSRRSRREDRNEEYLLPPQLSSSSKASLSPSSPVSSFPFCSEVNTPVRPILLESLLQDRSLSFSSNLIPDPAANCYYLKKEEGVKLESVTHFDTTPLRLTVMIIAIANLMGFLLVVGKVGNIHNNHFASTSTSSPFTNSSVKGTPPPIPHQVFLDVFSIGIAFAAATLPSLLVSTTFSRVKWSAATICLWAIRLTTIRIMRVITSHHNDPRMEYDYLQSKFGLMWYCGSAFLWGILCLLPHSLGTTSSNLGSKTALWIGLFIWLTGFILETTADWQKYVFHAVAPHRFCHIGLWAFAQQPNYNGEMMVWFGNFLMNATALVNDVIVEETGDNSYGRFAKQYKQSDRKISDLDKIRRWIMMYWRMAVALLCPLFVMISLIGQATGRPYLMSSWMTTTPTTPKTSSLILSPVPTRKFAALDLAHAKYNYGDNLVYTAYRETVPILLGLPSPKPSPAIRSFKRLAWMQSFDPSPYLSSKNNNTAQQVRQNTIRPDNSKFESSQDILSTSTAVTLLEPHLRRHRLAAINRVLVIAWLEQWLASLKHVGQTAFEEYNNRHEKEEQSQKLLLEGGLYPQASKLNQKHTKEGFNYEYEYPDKYNYEDDVDYHIDDFKQKNNIHHFSKEHNDVSYPSWLQQKRQRHSDAAKVEPTRRDDSHYAGNNEDSKDHRAKNEDRLSRDSIVNNSVENNGDHSNEPLRRPQLVCHDDKDLINECDYCDDETIRNRNKTMLDCCSGHRQEDPLSHASNYGMTGSSETPAAREDAKQNPTTPYETLHYKDPSELESDDSKIVPENQHKLFHPDHQSPLLTLYNPSRPAAERLAALRRLLEAETGSTFTNGEPGDDENFLGSIEGVTKLLS